MKHKSIVVFWGVCLLILSGCATNPTGDVARKWASNMRELGIIPIFPPREDVYVGDVYQIQNIPDYELTRIENDGYIPIGKLLGTVKSPEESFYKDRPDFPTTSQQLCTGDADCVPSAKNGISAAGAKNNQATNSAGNAGSDKGHRLRQVGFPEFLSAEFNAAQLSAFLPAEALSTSALGTGVSISDVKSASVKVLRAESDTLPASSFAALFKSIDHKTTNDKGEKVAYYATLDPTQLGYKNDHILQMLLSQARFPGDRDPDGAYINVVTEVFYAREIEVNVTSSVTKAANVTAPAPSPSITGSPATTSNLGAGSPANSSPPDPSQAATDRVKEEAKSAQVDLINQLTTKGLATIKAEGTAEMTVQMKRIYEHPIAIGYRCIHLRVNPDNLEVEAIKEPHNSVIRGSI